MCSFCASAAFSHCSGASPELGDLAAPSIGTQPEVLTSDGSFHTLSFSRLRVALVRPHLEAIKWCLLPPTDLENVRFFILMSDQPQYMNLYPCSEADGPTWAIQGRSPGVFQVQSSIGMHLLFLSRPDILGRAAASLRYSSDLAYMSD